MKRMGSTISDVVQELVRQLWGAYGGDGVDVHVLDDGTSVKSCAGWVQWDALPPRIRARVQQCLATGALAPDRMEVCLVLPLEQVRQARLGMAEAVRIWWEGHIERALGEVPVIRELRAIVEVWPGDQVQVRVLFRGKGA